MKKAVYQQLKLPHLEAVVLHLLEQARGESWTYETFLERALTSELEGREQKALARRLKSARIPANKTISGFDFAFQPSISQRRIRELADLSFVRTCTNVIFLGPPGTGKTHLSLALANQALAAGSSVLFTTLTELATALESASHPGLVRQRLRRYITPSLLVIDEVGYTKLSPEQARHFFELVTARYEHGSIILTSNTSFSQWGMLLGDEVLATALLDRLLHHAEVIAINGPSYRLKEFAAAIREALPQAVQVADRFHLIGNLVEHLDRFLTRQWKETYQAIVPPASITPGEAQASYSPIRVQRRVANAEEGARRYQQALAFREAGLDHQEIGQRLGVSARTIGRWLAHGRGPATQRRRKKPSRLDRFVPYILHRWAEGCRSGTVVHQELRERGYTGSDRTVYKFLQGLSATPLPPSHPKAVPPSASRLDGIPPRQIVRWILLSAQERENKAKEILALIGQASSEVAQTQILVEEFLTLARTLQGSNLEQWLERVKTTGAKELQQFAHGLERDKAAVVAGLTLPYSTGPVEGHINRLKLLKRQAYGRAGLAHLSRRFLAA